MNKLCPHCDFVGPEKTQVSGSLVAELAIWGSAFVLFIFGLATLILLIPAILLGFYGLYYSVSRHTKQITTCPKCGQPGMIPLDTPKAQRRIAEGDIPEPPPEKPIELNLRIWGTLLALLILGALASRL